MTRSKLSPYGPEAAKKAFRAKAKAEGVTFAEAAEARSFYGKPKPRVAPGMGRRTHGNDVGTVWNGVAYVGIPEFEEEGSDCDSDCPCWNFAHRHEGSPINAEGSAPTTSTFSSLLDIAKPAKLKGVAKEFEIVDRVKNVIVLQEEEQGGLGEWEEWEDVYEDEARELNVVRLTYSSVLKSMAREFEDG